MLPFSVENVVIFGTFIHVFEIGTFVAFKSGNKIKNTVHKKVLKSIEKKIYIC